MENSNLILTFLWIISIQYTQAILRGPPRIQTNEVKSLQVGRLGQEFRLNCPVESDPAPLVDWYKDGEDITGAWSRFGFKRTSKTLRIRPLQSEDSGIYECKGVNGFGSQLIKIRVIVVEDALTQDSKMDPTSLLSYNENNGSSRKSQGIKTTPSSLLQPPILSLETQEQSHSPIHLASGNSIRIRCEASGVPSPKITWFKDGKPIGEKLWKISSWTLFLSKLEFEDSGNYECVASNAAGRTNAQIRIHISELVEKRKPELASGYPANTTVVSGSEAVLECIVHHSGFSTIPPHIKWLKRVPTEEDLEKSVSRHNGMRLLPVEDTHVLVIQEIHEGGIHINESEINGTFISKLIITNTDLRDDGSYLCLATNSQGYTYKEAKLKILEKAEISSESSNQSSSLPFPLIVITLSILFGLILVGIAYFLRKHQEKNKPVKKVPTAKKIPPPISINTNFHQNPREGCEQRQLLVSTSAHSSSSSDRSIEGSSSHFHSHHHHLHHHQEQQQPIPLSRCSCCSRANYAHISKYPQNSTSFHNCYNDSFVGSPNHSLQLGRHHWS